MIITLFFGLGDGGPATAASLNSLFEIAVDGIGNLFIVDSTDNRVRKVDAATGIITTVAGDGQFAFSGDGGPATAASLQHPDGIAIDGAGNLFIADTNNNRIRKIDVATGIITTVAGDGRISFSGDNGPASAASIGIPRGIAVDRAGNLFIADLWNERIRVVRGIAVPPIK
jgi:sugar lactone lactonase YvrE